MILLLDVPRSYIVRSSLRRMLTHCHMGLWLRMSAIIVVVGVVDDEGVLRLAIDYCIVGRVQTTNVLRLAYLWAWVHVVRVYIVIVTAAVN